MWRYIVRGTRGNPVAMSAFTITTMFAIPIGLGTVVMNGRGTSRRSIPSQNFPSAPISIRCEKSKDTSPPFSFILNQEERVSLCAASCMRINTRL